MMKTNLTLLSAVLSSYLLAACSEAQFTGSPPGRAQSTNNTDTDETPGVDEPGTTPGTDEAPAPEGEGGTPNGNPDPGPGDAEPPVSGPGDGGTTPPVDEVTPPCKNTEYAVGAEITFLIDNSKSNEATDCPSAYADGKKDRLQRYSCRSQTNREKAVLAAYDLLDKVATGELGNDRARSRIAIASFPTEDNGMGESKGKASFVKQVDWLDVTAAKRSSVATSMMFARRPWGHTPYAAAFDAGTNLFADSTAGEKARVAVLVTDGEATDRNPNDVVLKAEALRQAGVKVFTIFYNTAGVTAAQRAAKHTTMLQSFDAAQRRSDGNNWFDAHEYTNFDAYIKSILGGDDALGLVKKISSDEQVVEVSDAAELESAFLGVIKKSIRCEAQ